MSMTRYRCYQGKAGCDNPVSSAGQTCAECGDAMEPADRDIAIGEDAFRAGWAAACLRNEPGHPSSLSAAWSEYTPPEELCGGGQSRT